MLQKFIHRPVLAIVVSLVLLFVGALAIANRPVSQFPEIAPPRVLVTIFCPGASAEVLVDSTLVPLERSINGVQDMKYMVSDATSAGEATIQVIFELGSDPDRAVVNVKNRVDQVLNQLPPLVQLEGVVVSRVQPSMLMYVNLYGTDDDTDEKFLYNFASIHLLPELQRTPPNRWSTCSATPAASLMTAVFVPVAFMSGPVGIFYRQFSITMASSIVLSGVVALTLTPVLCAMILRNTHGQPKRRTPIAAVLKGFNRGFERLTGVYVKGLERIVSRRLVTLVVLALFGVGIFAANAVLPAGFIPSEDQGMIYAIVQTPPGATLERTNATAKELQRIAEEVEGIESVSSLAGYEILTEGRGSNAGTCLINLKSWDKRDRSIAEIIEELEEKSQGLGAIVEFFEPPAVPGYGAAGGFALRLLDKTNSPDYADFDRINREFMDALGERKELSGLFTFYAANYPQFELIVDNERAMQKGVSIGKALSNLDILIGSTYEQGFVRLAFTPHGKSTSGGGFATFGTLPSTAICRASRAGTSWLPDSSPRSPASTTS